ncbi:hypothetical protein [Marixanthomonas spongiae]|uniref:Lipocalin-like domain-containing protein n=1 Tax=Marixanthomonas spongiae TaxID=2174845 RepID=A0A2U0HZB1_9FLAO|nr:hypothetical protein [Marixanthomonas spongiae]PVW14203.1 hypothetical protein DDV96_10365 [Marixanthomonas spongiae]
MKKLIFITVSLVLVTILISASTIIPEEKNTLKGVWELQDQYMYKNNMVVDTIKNFKNSRQVKMYSDSKVMWTRYNPKDSVEWFGYGNYIVKDGVLEERLEYGSYQMMKIIDTTQVFRFNLEMEKNTFSQIALDEQGNKYYSENYIRIE